MQNIQHLVILYYLGPKAAVTEQVEGVRVEGGTPGTPISLLDVLYASHQHTGDVGRPSDPSEAYHLPLHSAEGTV